MWKGVPTVMNMVIWYKHTTLEVVFVKVWFGDDGRGESEGGKWMQGGRREM